MFHFPLGLCRITNHTILRSVACPNNSEVRIIIRNFKPLYETVVYEYTTMTLVVRNELIDLFT